MSGAKQSESANVVVLDKETVLIKYEDATRVLWGDETSHQVSDWVYGKGERMAPFMFSLRSGEYFKWSEKWKPRYDQHRLYYVLEGQLSIHDPETGEVARAVAGEAIYWSGLRWHFGYNFGTQEALILEAVAPKERPPDMPEVEMSWEKPDLEKIVNGRYDLLGKWPAAKPESHRVAWEQGGIQSMTRHDCLHMIAGDKNPLPVTIFASTEEMTAGTMDILPGKIGDAERHPGDEALFVTEGRLNVYLPDSDDWYELDRKDCLYLPEGTPHQYANMTDHPTKFFFAVAPNYR